ncbi:aminoglycoside phosphotransferase [Prevotella bivia DNF00650]|uniref:phosphotransferase enzyme family protein n=1 Tax=Prevotella bivia TaxID=28125 RepID=UPI00050DD48B|nr:phosphotransferase [Prevotella bivia]KGF38467.1 aminoglycoside phosphotransferase [Prevotella bivia DNF00650]
MEENMLREIVAHFNIYEEVSLIKPLGNGLINETFIIETNNQQKKYVLQRINNAVFQDVDLLQHNIEIVTSHIRSKLISLGEADIERKSLEFIKADNGKTYFKDAQEKYWRISVFINDSITKEEVNTSTSYECGRMFGNFQWMLSDVKEQLGETIPNFHNIELRVRQLQDAVKADVKGRVKEVADIVNALLNDADKMCLSEQLYRQGALPKRLCHCDTKVSNMLFDKYDNPLCVIDLDTVMPSFIFSDYGDFLRTSANYVAEDSPKINEVGLKEDIFESFTGGYIETASRFLTEVEIKHLPYAAALFPYMQCVRFLADYINGDTYYKIMYPEHNLIRSQNQLALYNDMIAHEKMMNEFIKKFI